MTFWLTYAILFAVIFVIAYGVSRRCGNEHQESLWIAGVAALFITAMILVPAGQSEL